MRLHRLDLVRYGKFTERALEFGEAKPGEPDFHLIYGPNEAGKSTLFAGFLDLIFGIERSSPYGFLHPYQTMRIGGVVEAGSRLHHAYRIKRNANSLIGPDEQPLPDGLFSTALGSIDRATYCTMFSLDDDSIEHGGEAILKSEGELGSLLFSASSGLPDSTAILTDLRADADRFFRPQARKHQLAELKSEFDALKAERNAIDVNAREYAALRKALTGVRARHEAAARLRHELRADRDRIRAQRDALPLLARLTGVRQQQLAAQPPLPVPPAEWQEELPLLCRRDAEIAAQLRQLQDELKRRREELSGLPRDEQALAAAERFEALRDAALEARYLTAARDMPSRLEELSRTAAEIDACLLRLGEAGNPDVASLLLPTARAIRLQDLVRRHASLSERLASAREELEMAEANRSEAERESARLKEGAADPALLAERVHLLRQSDCLLRQQASAREIERLEMALSDRLDALRPFAGSIDDLAALPAPAPGLVDAWRAEDATAAERRLRLGDRIADESERQAGDKARLAALAANGGAVDDATACALRQRRDSAWQKHRASLDDRTATLFEAALNEHDAATARRLAQADRVAETRSLALAITERGARLQALEAQRKAIEEEHERRSATIGEAAHACGLPGTTALPQLEAWLGTRAAAVELRAELRNALKERNRADAEEKAAVGALRVELARLGMTDALPDRLDALLAAAERVASRAQAASTAYRNAVSQVERATEALEKRQAGCAAAEAAMASWCEEWEEALAGTWLSRQVERPLPQEIGPVLAVLQDLDKLMQKKGELDHRIAGMGRDQAAFTEAVRGFAATLGEGPAGDVLALFSAIRDRVAAALQKEERRQGLQGDIERMQESIDALYAEEKLHAANRQRVLDFFGCGSLDEAASCLEATREEQRLRQRCFEMETDLATRLSVATSAEAEALLTALHERELALELARLEEAIDAADQEVSELHADVRSRERALAAIEGGDRVAELDQRRRTLLLDIESKAVGYLRLRAGVIAAEQALRLFRERHRSAMMQRASRTFTHISGGEYSGLSTQADKGQEFLIANTAAGGSKLARDLSKGTRFQLYLALRIAGYHEVAATRETLPFIADDIMETFDDGRAGRAFELMAEMAEVGQVIYLTHHEHLCDIARSACPGVTIHRL
ncbi:AAA family ATPase [Sinorhizobium medicae]|uniref:ATP-binding protein n=1 Tax=Sinorhizobium medicae TaxID=110321 RepID=UPI000C7E172D|nr:AAA family ATPase [Sinorhizobium medicae]MBO1939785.1 AAA family ATPase [Sinorhizobium medicae]MDX0482648.1 AAA family ATPase [Sinorhizobium medicae]MDX0497751.1 AAA family ATPase [Sinorhizobium medicae]MDX0507586.1 AAA family ATPase [Sinorhizobium medicae]MDX0514546.1 AAA family ATPase [Sinorhizobium medicae]